MPDFPLYHLALYRYAIYHGCIISLLDITVKGLKIKKLSRRGEQRQTTRENRSTIVEQSVIHPDADAGTQHRDDEGADAAGGMDADEAEQELAHKAAQNTQHDVAAGGSLGAHEAVGDVTARAPTSTPTSREASRPIRENRPISTPTRAQIRARTIRIDKVIIQKPPWFLL